MKQLFLLLTILAFCKSGGVAEEQTPNPWRTAANGGVNILHCYLQVHGISSQYDELLRDQEGQPADQPHSALSLARLSARHGLPLQAVSLTIDELRSCSLPVIVHMDGDSPETGAFLLIFEMSDTEISYVNGPSAAMHEMNWENFRRVWSGVALLPAPTQKKNVLWASAGLAIGLILPMGFRLFRSKNRV